MNDITERLRKHVKDRGGSALAGGAWAMMMEAADEIDRLRSIMSGSPDAVKLAERFIAGMEGNAPAPPRVAGLDVEERYIIRRHELMLLCKAVVEGILDEMG